MTVEQAQHSFAMLVRLLNVPNIRGDHSWRYYTGTGAWPLYMEPRRAIRMDNSSGLCANDIYAFRISSPADDRVKFLVNWLGILPVIFVKKSHSLVAVMTWSMYRQKWILVDRTDRTAFECEVVQ